MPYLTPDIAPDDTICLKLNIPNDVAWIGVVKGALSELIKAYNFEQFGTSTPEETAYRFLQMYDEFVFSVCGENMGCCTDIILKRYTEEGVLQVSTDGGETWTDAPWLDPRIISPVFPGVDGYTKCDYAVAYIGWLLTQVINPTADILSTGATIALIIGIIGAALILLIVTGGLAGLAIPIAIELAAYLLTITSTELTDSFSAETMQEIVCLLFCYIEDDGTISAERFSEMTAAIDAYISDPTARIVMRGIFVLSGNVGTTNAMHSEALAAPGSHAPEGYCDDCNCGGCDFSEWVVANGTLVDQDANHITVAAELIGSQWLVTVRSPNIDQCCCGIAYEKAGGGGVATIGYNVCHYPWYENVGFAYTGQEANAMLYGDPAPYTITITSAEPCE